MYYEINVALKDEHYFATAPRSITTPKEAFQLAVHFKKAFPKSEGYTIQIRLKQEEAYTAELTGKSDVQIARAIRDIKG